MDNTQSLLCHMAILLEDGSTADNTKGSGKPVKLTIGDDSITAAFENEIKGLVAGDKHKFTLQSKDAFGAINPDLIYHMDKSRFNNPDELAKGVIMGFSGADGHEIPGIICDIIADSVTVDFNHPLAGHNITIDLEVIKLL